MHPGQQQPPLIKWFTSENIKDYYLHPYLLRLLFKPIINQYLPRESGNHCCWVAIITAILQYVYNTNQGLALVYYVLF